MKRQLRYIPLTALLLGTLLTAAGCHSDDEPTTATTIAFGANVRAVDTRAGQTACMDNAALAASGFGVFANSATVGFGSDWLSNKRVSYTVTPVPDELGLVHLHPGNWNYDGKKDWTDGASISFYAYAPYVSAGAAEPGITDVDGTTPSDPTVSYQVATTPSQAVDLLWGVKGETGLPWTNATLTATGGLVTFTFHHALAAVGFRAQVMVDKHNNLTDLDDQSATGQPGTNECKVTIKSIKFTAKSPGSFYETGTLNLHNTTANQPLWSDQTGSLNDFEVSETAIDAALLDPAPADAAAIATFMNNASIPGITESANSQLVIAQKAATLTTPAAEQCWMFIPHAAQDYTLTVEYYVTYKTSSTPTYNRYDYTGTNAKTIDITGLELKPDTKYYFNLVFGLKTLNFTVDATDWTAGDASLDALIEHGTSANQSLAPRRTH